MALILLWPARMRAAVLAAILAVPIPAAADPAASETVEREMGRGITTPDTTDNGVHATAYAQLAAGGGGDTSGGSLSAGADLRWSGAHCDYVRLGGSVRLAYESGGHASAENWASVCGPLMSAIELSHHLEWDVRPSLLAPLDLRRGLNRRETIGFHWQPIRGKLGHVIASLAAGETVKEHAVPEHPPDPDDPKLPQGDAIIFDTRIEDQTLWSADAPTPAWRIRVDSSLFGYIHDHRAAWGEARDFEIDLFNVGGEFGEDAAALHFWGIRILNLKTGPVYSSGGIGITSASAGPFVDLYTREVDLTSVRGMLGVETGGRRVHGFVRSTYDTAVAPDGYATLEARAAAGLAWNHSALLRMELDATAARTHIYVPGMPEVTRPTGGASVSVMRQLPHRLSATAQVDVARSFYATGDASGFDTSVGVTAFGAVRASVGR